MKLSRETIERINGILADGWEKFIGKGLIVEMALKRWRPPIADGIEIDWQCRGEYENDDNYPFAADGWVQCGLVLPTDSIGERTSTARADNALPSIRLAGLPGSAERIAAYRAHDDRLPGVSPFALTDDDIADNLARMMIPNPKNSPTGGAIREPKKRIKKLST